MAVVLCPKKKYTLHNTAYIFSACPLEINCTSGTRERERPKSKRDYLLPEFRHFSPGALRPHCVHCVYYAHSAALCGTVGHWQSVARDLLEETRSVRVHVAPRYLRYSGFPTTTPAAAAAGGPGLLVA